jgi:predicted homoserine dehydrogenase-like protein
MTYGEAVSAADMRSKRYLPEGLVEGCRLSADIAKDTVITYDDVVLPAGRLADRLYQEQCERFADLPAKAGSDATSGPSAFGRKDKTAHALAS